MPGLAPVSKRLNADASNTIENDYYKITCDANGSELQWRKAPRRHKGLSRFLLPQLTAILWHHQM
jgi:hypothetical protein